MDMVTVKYFNFNSICSTVVTKLKTSSNQKNPTMLEYKVDAGSDGNLMLVNIFKVLFQKHQSMTE